MAKAVSRQVKLTLPDALYEDLEFWAKTEGRAVANLANFLMEIAIKKAKKDGDFPKRDSAAQLEGDRND